MKYYNNKTIALSFYLFGINQNVYDTIKKIQEDGIHIDKIYVDKIKIILNKINEIRPVYNDIYRYKNKSYKVLTHGQVNKKYYYINNTIVNKKSFFIYHILE